MTLTFEVVFFLVLGFVSLLVSGVLFFRFDKATMAVMVLLCGSFVMGCAFALLDPFLNLWDEQFHALVAKNLGKHIWHPTLYDVSVVPPGTDWTGCHTWLHKQPLFLWQMALGMKLFGVSVFWMRFPSVLMHTVLTFFIYRIGKISAGDRVGFLGAALFTFAHFPLELVAGLYHTDHNDVAFLFYVTASCWAWFEHRQKQNGWWLLVIGLFAGAAVLVKWLTGLLVYAGWMSMIVLGRQWRETWRLVFSLVIAAAVFVPWQLYILWKFPEAAAREYRLNSAHFFETVEDHGGGWLFHWDAMEKLYGSGDAIPYIFLAGLVFLVFSVKDRAYKVFIAAVVTVTYVFFTLAATKMYSFTLVVCPFFFLGVASLVHRPLQWMSQKWPKARWPGYAGVFVLALMCWALIDMDRVMRQHTLADADHNNGREENLEELSFIESLRLPEPDDRYVVFNANLTYFGAIPFMFHRDFAAAYDFLPTEAQIEMTVAKGYIPVVIDPAPGWDFQGDPRVYVVFSPGGQ